MIVGYGRIQDKPKGALPVFSVNTLEEARQLLVRTCPRNYNGEFVAQELAVEQTLENLFAFGDRLEAAFNSRKAKK